MKLDLTNVSGVIFDLDGTLIFQDSLYEQIKAVLRFSKSKFFSCLFTLISKGRVHFKKKVFQINEMPIHTKR